MHQGALMHITFDWIIVGSEISEIFTIQDAIKDIGSWLHKR